MTVRRNLTLTTKAQEDPLDYVVSDTISHGTRSDCPVDDLLQTMSCTKQSPSEIGKRPQKN